MATQGSGHGTRQQPTRHSLAFDFVDQDHVVDAAGFAVGAGGEVGAADDYDSVAFYGVTVAARPEVDVADKLLHIKCGESTAPELRPSTDTSDAASTRAS